MSFPRFPLLAAILLALPLAPAQTRSATPRRREDAHRHELQHPKPSPPSAYNGHPKLAIVLVIDHFTGEDLEQWRADFDKNQGFERFLNDGAWFPDCYFDYANTEGAPGDAAIATGAYTNGNGISANSWWSVERNQKRPVSSVEDPRYEMVGLPPANAPAAQPAGSTTSTAASASTAGAANGPGAAATAAPAAKTTATPANSTVKAPASQAGTATTPSTPASQPAGTTNAPANSAQSTGQQPAATNPARPASPRMEPGASPVNLLASTLGDELRLATEGQSRVYGVALRDRPAVLLAGAGANAAFWVDAKSGYWITSSFYMPQLPPWVDGFNNGDDLPQAEEQAGVQGLTNFYKQVGTTPAANQYVLEFAENLIQNEQLGQRNVTDLLTISLSANNGQTVTPGSAQEQQNVDALDTQLDGFFSWLDKNIPGGLGNVWVALTSNHGVAPAPVTAAGYGLNAAQIDLPKLIANLNLAINMKFSPGEKIAYVLPHQRLPYISLDESQFMKDGIDEQEAEQAVQQALPTAFGSLAAQGPQPLPSESQAPASESLVGVSNGKKPQFSEKRLPPTPVLFRSYTRIQLATGPLPPTPWGRLIANSYSPNGGWYVMVIPGPYQSAAGRGADQFGAWAYNRHVPLALWGAPFQAGTYLNQVQPVDIAPTFAALLGINEPSAAVGKVLTEALKPADRVVYPAAVVHHETAHPAGADHRAAAAAKPAAKPAAPAPAKAAPGAGAKPGAPQG